MPAFLPRIACAELPPRLSLIYSPPPLPARPPPATCRRTAFVFELDDAEAADVPTTLRRSKEDCPKVRK
jgi:hypothetical protein